MPKVKSKLKMSFYLSRTQYWCIQYLIIVTNRNASEIIDEAIKYSIRYLNETRTNPRRPKLPTKSVRQTANIPRETAIAAGLVKINKEFFGWSNTDFVRYGLTHTLASYKERYPVMRKIENKYDLYQGENNSLEAFE